MSTLLATARAGACALIPGGLKINIFCENLQIPSFYFKEQSLKLKKEIKIFYIFYFQKMGKTVFELKNSNKSYFLISLHF